MRRKSERENSENGKGGETEVREYIQDNKKKTLLNSREDKILEKTEICSKKYKFNGRKILEVRRMIRLLKKNIIRRSREIEMESKC